MKQELIKRLQKWYFLNCDGDWEHSYGITISTLDNPGWNVEIDLADTALRSLEYEIVENNNDLDWFVIKVTNQIFQASGDIDKLDKILSIFLDECLAKHSDASFTYEVYVPLVGSYTPLWRPVKARVITEDALEITEIPDFAYESLRFIQLEDVNFEKNTMANFDSSYSIGDLLYVEIKKLHSGITLVAK